MPRDRTDTQTRPGAATLQVLQPIVEQLVRQNDTRPTRPTRLLDYGAGRHARNADYFRQLYADHPDVHCYAYDPFKSTGPPSGWDLGSVTSEKPDTRFDLLFTSYVLNVVPSDVEDQILDDCDGFSAAQVHIVRDDLRGAARRWLLQGNPVVTDWYCDEFATAAEVKELVATAGRISDATLLDFVRFGFETSKGFQRQTDLSCKGYEQYARQTGRWVAWAKGL